MTNKREREIVLNYTRKKQQLEKQQDSAKIKMDSIESKLNQKHKQYHYYNLKKQKFSNNDGLEYVDDMANKFQDPANTISLAGLGVATALLCSGAGAPAAPVVAGATTIPSAIIDIYSGIRHIQKDNTIWEGLGNIGLGLLNILPYSKITKIAPRLSNAITGSSLGRSTINAANHANTWYKQLIDKLAKKFRINPLGITANTIKNLPSNLTSKGIDDITGLTWNSKIPIYGDSLRNTQQEIDSLNKEYNKLKEIYYNWIPLPNYKNKDNNKNKSNTNIDYINK